ncbi:MAG: hypothetical protein SFT90_08370 [Rickettsiales bacterium]|nr:hypothetical protein [Rickettsiales bacterium]
MTTMIIEIYDALKDAGASEDKSRKAAEAIADYDNRFNKIETELLIIKWMLGTVLAGVMALVLKNFF